MSSEMGPGVVALYEYTEVFYSPLNYNSMRNERKQFNGLEERIPITYLNCSEQRRL